MKMLSLFSGCGGMDIGFEGEFWCLRKSVNTKMHPDWIQEEKEDWVKLSPTIFETVFANDIRPDAKAAWVSYFSKRHEDANHIYRLDSIVDLVKRAQSGEDVFPGDIDVVTGGFPCQSFSNQRRDAAKGCPQSCRPQRAQSRQFPRQAWR